MIKLESYLEGRWQAGKGAGRAFVNPTTGEQIGTIDSSGLDLGAAARYARDTGGASLRAMTFAQRGALLGAMADAMMAKREDYVTIARENSGNTARDIPVDVDGGIVTLKFYARLAKSLGDALNIIEDGADQLTKADTFKSRHVWTTRPGLAIHINAFNFPSWGLWEKVAVAFLAGVPVLAKPASGTAWLSERMVRDVVAANLLPEGALSLVCGAAEGMLDACAPFDTIAFTGSADTGLMIRSNKQVMTAAPRVMIEADSVNVAILAPGAKVDGEAFQLLVREVNTALTTKAGQLCTNIRRVLAPRELMPALVEALSAKIDKITIGNPARDDVMLGPLVDERQRRSALEGLAKLTAEAKVVRGGSAPAQALDADPAKGSFLAPTLLQAGEGAQRAIHDVEVFGPVVTVIPYDGMTEAVALAARGGGSLAASIYSDDSGEAAQLALGIAPYHGRILNVDPIVGKGHTGHSIVMPQCVHGGPGRAGGGEELGGLRGLRAYMQRTALQGSPQLLEAVAQSAATGAL